MRYTRSILSASFNSAQLNAELQKIQTAINDTLSRKGDSPNDMSADLDMDSNRIFNLPDPVNGDEPITLNWLENNASNLPFVQTVVAGTGIAVDDSGYPTVSISNTGVLGVSGGTGITSSGGQTPSIALDPSVQADIDSKVDSVSAGTNVTVTGTATDPVVNVPDIGVESVTAGSGINVDNSDPDNPVVSSTVVPGGQVDSVVAGTNVTVDNTDPANPIVSASVSGGNFQSVVAGDNISVNNADPNNPIVSLTDPIASTITVEENSLAAARINLRNTEGGAAFISDGDDFTIYNTNSISALQNTQIKTFGADGAVALYHGNVQRLITTATGVQVNTDLSTTTLQTSGLATLDSLSVTNNTTVNNLTVTGTTTGIPTGNPIDVEDDAVSIETGIDTINFTGPGVVVTNPVAGQVNVAISGSAVPGGDVTSVNGFTGDVTLDFNDFAGAGDATLDGGILRINTNSQTQFISDRPGSAVADWQLRNDAGGAIFRTETNGRFELRQGSNIGAAENIWLRCERDSSVDIYHNGSRRIRTTATGIQIRTDTDLAAGDAMSNQIIFGDSAAETWGAIGFPGSANMHITNTNPAGNIVLQAQTAGDTTLNILNGNADGDTDIYANGDIRLSAEASGNGVSINSSTSPGIGNLQQCRLVYRQADGTFLGVFGYDGVNNEFRIKSNNHGNSIVIVGEDDAGTERVMATFDPDAMTTFYSTSITAENLRLEANVNTMIDLDRDGTGVADIVLRNDSGGTALRHTGGSTFQIRGRDSANGDLGELARFIEGSGCQLYYNNALAFETVADGARVRSPGGGNSNLYLMDNDGQQGLVFKSASGPLNIRNTEHGGVVNIEAEDGGGALQQMITATPGSTVLIRHDGERVFQTRTGGIQVFSDSSNVNSIFEMYSGGSRSAFILSNASGNLEMRGEIPGGSLILRAEDTGGVARTLLEGDPDSGTDLNYAGTRRIRTASDGMQLRSDNNETIGAALSMQYKITDSSGETWGALGYPSSANLFVSNLNHGGNVVISAEDAGGVAQTLATFDPDNGRTTLDGGDNFLPLDVTSNQGSTYMRLINSSSTVRFQLDGSILRFYTESPSTETIFFANPDAETTLYFNRDSRASTFDNGFEVLDKVGNFLRLGQAGATSYADFTNWNSATGSGWYSWTNGETNQPTSGFNWSSFTSRGVNDNNCAQIAMPHIGTVPRQYIRTQSGATWSTWRQLVTSTDLTANSWDLDRNLEVSTGSIVSRNPTNASASLTAVNTEGGVQLRADGGGAVLYQTNLAGAAEDNWIVCVKNARVELRYNNNIKLQTTNTGVGITGTCEATAFNATSTRRLKQNIQEIDLDAMEMLDYISPVQFEWVDDFEGGDPGTHFGFIAEEVEEFIPEVVGYNEEGEVTGLNYQEMIALLWAQNQEMKARIEELEEIVDALH